MDRIKEYCDKNVAKQLYNLVDIVKDSIAVTSQGDTTVLDNINADSFRKICNELLIFLDAQED